LEITKVASEADLHLVSRLRYDVTVSEMGLRMTHVDHKTRTVVEPLDRVGHVFAAWEDGQLVGTVRTNFLHECDIGFYREAYSIDELQNDARVAVTTRLAVAAPYRHGPTAVRLATAAYAFGLAHGIVQAVVDCRKLLVPMFIRLGYVVHRRHLTHPEFGEVTVLKLDLHDERQLRACRSPFHRVLQRSSKGLNR
jgi:hypothetical protein